MIQRMVSGQSGERRMDGNPSTGRVTIGRAFAVMLLCAASLVVIAIAVGAAIGRSAL